MDASAQVGSDHGADYLFNYGHLVLLIGSPRYIYRFHPQNLS